MLLESRLQLVTKQHHVVDVSGLLGQRGSFLATDPLADLGGPRSPDMSPPRSVAQCPML
jgi:hypothetical protein